MDKENAFENALSHLKERVDLVEKSYNPDQLNLHFDNLVRADPALFEALSSIGYDAWNVTKDNQSWKTSYWFYDFFLLTSRASVKILDDKNQRNIPEIVIKQLALILIEISQITTKAEYSGDITKRNLEALANLLLTFNGFINLEEILITRAKEMNNEKVLNFSKRAIEWARQVENQRYSRAAT
jgi:hypothetical protein